jgi:tetratricopeptide (TPR) repeat protein
MLRLVTKNPVNMPEKASERPHPDPAILPSLLRQAAGLRNAGHLGDAVAKLAQAAAIAPRNPIIRHDLGLSLLNLGDAEAALPHLEAALAENPGLAQAHFRRGMALEALDRPGAADAYQRAIDAGFENPTVFSRLATLFHRAGRRDDAATLYRHAASLAPGTLSALLDAARAALIENRLEEAETLSRQALRLQPDNATARTNLAYILGAKGDFAAAEAELRRALADHPDEAGLYYELAHTRRITQADAPLIAAMRAAQARPHPPTTQLKLHLALAKALDETGDYQAARTALEAADRLRSDKTPFDRAALTARHDRIIASFTPACIANTRHQRSTSNLPVLVVGLPRSGTTLLERMLARHPDMAGAGEVYFWQGQGRAALEKPDLASGADWRDLADQYLALLREAGPAAACVVDKMPFNFAWAPVIHLALPNARILHITRHPADTALSIMAHHMAATPSFPTQHADLVFYVREYQRMMAHARHTLPPTCLFELDYEHLVAEPERMIRAVLDFCGLDFHPDCLSPELAAGPVLTFSKFQARQKIHGGAAGRHRHYGDFLADFSALAEAPPAHLALVQRADMLKAAGQPAQALAIQQRAALLYPNSAVAHHNLAAGQGDLGRFAQAEASARAAFAQGGDAPQTWLVLARALLGQNRLDDADHGFREAIRRQPGYVDAHRDLAQLIWMRTENAGAALALLDETLRRQPDAALLETRANLLRHAGDIAGARQSLRQALRLAPNSASLLIAAAHIAALDGDAAAALTLADSAIQRTPDSEAAQDALFTACVATGNVARANALAARMVLARPLDQRALAYQATAWRLADDPRYAALYDYPGLVRATQLDVPKGWANLESYLADLAAALGVVHAFHTHPLDQSLRHGSQAPHLKNAADPVIQAFFQAVDGPIRRHLTWLGRGEDPVRARNTGDYTFQGVWSVRLRPGGFHTDHIHPQGWLSSACYIALPDLAAKKGQEAWIKFGQPGLPTMPALGPEHVIEPKPGMLVLFPSYMWHGTVPFSGGGPRLSVAFDLVPRSRGLL